jgi:hypothetical protein
VAELLQHRDVVADGQVLCDPAAIVEPEGVHVPGAIGGSAGTARTGLPACRSSSKDRDSVVGDERVLDLETQVGERLVEPGGHLALALWAVGRPRRGIVVDEVRRDWLVVVRDVVGR